MSLQTEPLVSSDDREAFHAQLRFQEFRKGLRAVKERFNFLPRFQAEINVIKETQGSTLGYLDRLSFAAYQKSQSNTSARTAVRRAVAGFQERFDSAINGLDQAHAVMTHLEGAHGSFAQALPEDVWRRDTELRSALMNVSHFSELNAIVDSDGIEEGTSMPMPFDGLTEKEANEKITDILGVMTAKGVRSTASSLENSEYARMHFWGERLIEADGHAYGRTSSTEELGVIASKLLLSQ